MCILLQNTPTALIALLLCCCWLQALIQGHADPDLVDRDDRTTLHVAALNGHAHIVQVSEAKGQGAGRVAGARKEE